MRAEVRAVQERRFAALVRRILPANPFQRSRYEPLGFTCSRPIGLSDLQSLPLISRAELVADQHAHPPYGTNLTFPLGRYTRMHSAEPYGQPRLRWLDTAESWEWNLDCWVDVYDAAQVTGEDRLLVLSGFGPDFGAWGALEAAQRLGAFVLPGGGAPLKRQLEMLRSHEVTVLVCGPVEAEGLLDPAQGPTLDAGSLRAVLLTEDTGESGAERARRLEAVCGSPVYRVASSAEIGTWGHDCPKRTRFHVNEHRFLAEIVDPPTGELVPAEDGERRGELVITNLGRVGSPLLRFRTGRQVIHLRCPCTCGRETALRPVQ